MSDSWEVETNTWPYVRSKTDPRAPWDEYFMDVARTVATRSTCSRAHVGCVLVRNKRILTTGYNGSPPMHFHCDDVGHELENGHCVRTVHAEVNAIIQAARHGVTTEGATAYITHSPCRDCSKALLTAGVERVVYGELRGDSVEFPNAESACG